jgi:hypothetical protein
MMILTSKPTNGDASFSTTYSALHHAAYVIALFANPLTDMRADIVLKIKLVIKNYLIIYHKDSLFFVLYRIIYVQLFD